MVQSIVEPKRGTSVGRVVVDVLVENFEDRLRAGRGELAAEEVRRVTVPALVDSGATFFCMPEPLISRLGLSFLQQKESRTVTGPVRLGVYAAARLEVQGRDCVTQVHALPEGRQALLSASEEASRRAGRELHLFGPERCEYERLAARAAVRNYSLPEMARRAVKNPHHAINVAKRLLTTMSA